MSDQFSFKVDIEAPKQANKVIFAAVEKAFRTCAAELDGRFDAAISQSVWDWPRDTQRGLGGSSLAAKAKAAKAGKGNTVGTPRNIVDSGDLKSRKMMNINGLSAEWSWNIDYAAAVHDGARINPWGNKNVTVTLPARPWTNAVLEGGVANYNGDTYDFATEMQKKLGKFLK